MGFHGLSPRPHREEVAISAFEIIIGGPRGRFKEKPENSYTKTRLPCVRGAPTGSTSRRTFSRPTMCQAIVINRVKLVTFESLGRRINRTVEKERKVAS